MAIRDQVPGRKKRMTWQQRPGPWAGSPNWAPAPSISGRRAVGRHDFGTGRNGRPNDAVRMSTCQQAGLANHGQQVGPQKSARHRPPGAYSSIGVVAELCSAFWLVARRKSSAARQQSGAARRAPLEWAGARPGLAHITHIRIYASVVRLSSGPNGTWSWAGGRASRFEHGHLLAGIPAPGTRTHRADNTKQVGANFWGPFVRHFVPMQLVCVCV